jgi:hypothetical protein
MPTKDEEWMYHTPDPWTQFMEDQENAQLWAYQQQLEEQQMAFKHEHGRGSGWTNQSDNPKAPKLKGSMCWNGEQINWAIWKNVKKKDTDPDWGLKLEEPRDMPPKSSGGNFERSNNRDWNKKEEDFPF